MKNLLFSIVHFHLNKPNPDKMKIFAFTTVCCLYQDTVS